MKKGKDKRCGFPIQNANKFVHLQKPIITDKASLQVLLLRQLVIFVVVVVAPASVYKDTICVLAAIGSLAFAALYIKRKAETFSQLKNCPESKCCT
jgi:hypothetical protein